MYETKRLDKLLPSRNVAVGLSGNTVDVAITW